MLHALWAVQVQLERLGLPIGHLPTTRMILSVDPAAWDDEHVTVLAAMLSRPAGVGNPYVIAAQGAAADFGPRPRPVRICRVCGCTDDTPCSTPLGTCAWSAGDAALCTSCEGHVAALDQAQADVRLQRLEAVAIHARAVMNDLQQYPDGSIVPHLLDSDENDGQSLRDALDALART
jgi:hypothetical protein